MSGLSGHVVVEQGSFRLDVEVEVAAGEVVAVLGPNGAGKSTLLRAVAGLTPMSGGRLTLSGTVVDDPAADRFVPPGERRIGLVFQDYRLFPHLSVIDNLAFGLRSGGASKAESRRRAGEWVSRLGLDELAHRKPATLSGGQAQRVALGRALAPDPLALLLDEPLAALDPATRGEVRGVLGRRLAAYPGVTLLVTHDPLDALVLADRIVVLEGGSVTQQGEPWEVARRPATRYVARLLGINLLPGSASGGEVALDGGGTLHVADDADHHGHVLVAVRPSAISLHAAEPEGSARNVWRGVVDGVEPIGDRVRVTVTGDPTVIVDVTPGAVADLRLSRGTGLWLSAKATELDVYPA